MCHPISCASGLQILTMTKHFSHQARRLPNSKNKPQVFSLQRAGRLRRETLRIRETNLEISACKFKGNWNPFGPSSVPPTS